MESPITTECDALREEVAMLESDIFRLMNQNIELRKYPEAAVRAVWEHGMRHGWEMARRYKFVTDDDFDYNAEEVSRIFTEALQKGE